MAEPYGSVAAFIAYHVSVIKRKARNLVVFRDYARPINRHFLMMNDDKAIPEQDVDTRRDEVVRRMLNTPPKPHPKPKEGRRRGRPNGT